MGNYQDYLKQTNPLRELDPGMNRAHMFGNPFKLAKDQVCTIFVRLVLSFNITSKSYCKARLRLLCCVVTDLIVTD